MCMCVCSAAVSRKRMHLWLSLATVSHLPMSSLPPFLLCSQRLHLACPVRSWRLLQGLRQPAPQRCVVYVCLREESITTHSVWLLGVCAHTPSLRQRLLQGKHPVNGNSPLVTTACSPIVYFVYYVYPLFPGTACEGITVPQTLRARRPPDRSRPPNEREQDSVEGVHV